jgi:hypothetical protein
VIPALENEKEKPCDHRYIVGYSFRMPNALFRSVPCDKCGSRIRLSTPWYLLFCLTQLIGFFIAFYAAQSVQVNVLGTTLPISLAIFLVVMWVVHLIGRIILRYGKWVKADKK